MLAMLIGFLGISLGAMTSQDVALHPRLDLSFFPESFQGDLNGTAGERARAIVGCRLDAHAFGDGGFDLVPTLFDGAGYALAFEQFPHGIPVFVDYQATVRLGGYDGWAPSAEMHELRAIYSNTITVGFESAGATWYAESVTEQGWHHTSGADDHSWRFGVRKEW